MNITTILIVPVVGKIYADREGVLHKIDRQTAHGAFVEDDRGLSWTARGSSYQAQRYDLVAEHVDTKVPASFNEDLVRAALNGKTIQWAKLTIDPPQWVEFKTAREAIYSLASVSSERLQFRVKPEPIECWATLSVSVGSGSLDPWVNGERCKGDARATAMKYQRAVVLRLVLDPDTLDVIEAKTEKP